MSISLDLNAQSNRKMKLEMKYIFKENKIKIASNFSEYYFSKCVTRFQKVTNKFVNGSYF